jgi:hypothetical protein
MQHIEGAGVDAGGQLYEPRRRPGRSGGGGGWGGGGWGGGGWGGGAEVVAVRGSRLRPAGLRSEREAASMRTPPPSVQASPQPFPHYTQRRVTRQALYWTR